MRRTMHVGVVSAGERKVNRPASHGWDEEPRERHIDSPTGGARERKEIKSQELQAGGDKYLGGHVCNSWHTRYTQRRERDRPPQIDAYS